MIPTVDQLQPSLISLVTSTYSQSSHNYLFTQGIMTISSNITILLLIRRRGRTMNLTYRQNISLAAKRRRDRRISRVALMKPTMSAFETLFGSGYDRSLITLTGFDHNSFRYIHESFSEIYSSYSPYSDEGNIRIIKQTSTRQGKPRSLTSQQCLAITLTWYRTRGSVMVLCIIFGVSASVCSLFLRFGRRLLLEVLQSDVNAGVKMPTDEEIGMFQESFLAKYSSLGEIYAVADGLKLYLQQSGDVIIQNMFYNGWTHDHYISNVFVFAPHAVVIACAINAPGSIHDSIVAEGGRVYEKLEEVLNRTGGTCVVDSAFSRGHYPFLVKSSQDMPATNNYDVVLTSKQASSARQAAEWGMRAFQGSFPRNKDRLVYEQRGERTLIIHLLVPLFNVRSD